MEKIIVFDLDETIGSFSELYIFWSLTKSYFKEYDLNYQYFYKILDTFPNFFRPEIFTIFKNIKNKKISGHCKKVIIFTNNNGPKWWAELIKSYIHYKLNYELFDQIIRAYKINNILIEKNRTSHEKSYSDLINCSNENNNIQVCFIDDLIHEKMKHDNVYYINITPYHNNENFTSLALSFYNNNINLFKNNSYEIKNNYIKFIENKTRKYNLNVLQKSKIIKNIEYLLSLYVNKLINNFLNSKSNTNNNIGKTKKAYRNKIRKKTYKK
tara:strand:- start:336 stop:1142 length:807 start_codon:yes stop_codon:yes gene_type:complete